MLADLCPGRAGVDDGKLAANLVRLLGFRVEAVMSYESDLLRPGMEGISKLEIGREKLIWIWTRRMIDWLRLFIWQRLP